MIGIIFLSGTFFYYEKYDFVHFLENNNQKRQITQSLPSKEIIKMISIGHTNSYADFLWLSMIQYIGDNLSKSNYTNFSLKLIDSLTDISPKFITAYEWALLIMPIPQNNNLTYTEEQKENLIFPLEIAKKGIQNNCDLQKVQYIAQYPISNFEKLLQDEQYQNPCTS